MDGTQLLEQDHRKVEGIFQQFAQGGDSQQFNQLFQQLFEELTVHAIIEEQIFYPELAKYAETASLVPEVYEEHAEAKAALAELAALDNTTAEWSQKITTLRDDILHHVQLEEQDIFTAVRQRMTPQQLDELGSKLEQARSAAKGSYLLSQPLQEIQKAQAVRMSAQPATAMSATSGFAAMPAPPPISGGQSIGSQTMRDDLGSPPQSV